MIVISKNDECLNIFRTLYKSFTKTAKFSGSPKLICFDKKGLWIDFENHSRIHIKNNYDDSFYTTSELFISAVLAHFDNSDEDLNLEIIDEDGELYVKIDDFKISCQNDSADCHFSLPSSKALMISAEQWNKLDQYFADTISNYKNPETIDTIGYFINEGKIVQLVPSSLGVSIKNVDATVDTVALEQGFGHSYELFLLPKKYYDIFKDKDISVSFDYYDDDPMMGISSSDGVSAMFVLYKKNNVSLYKNYYFSLLEHGDGNDLNSIKDILLKYQGIAKHFPADSDNYTVQIDGNELSINNDMMLSIDNPTNFSLETEMQFLCRNLMEMQNPKWKEVKKDARAYIEIYDDSHWLYFQKPSYE